MPWIKRGDGCTGIPPKMQWAWALHKVGVRGMLRGKGTVSAVACPSLLMGEVVISPGPSLGRAGTRRGHPGPGTPRGWSAVPTALPVCQSLPRHSPGEAENQGREPGLRAMAQSQGCVPRMGPGPPELQVTDRALCRPQRQPGQQHGQAPLAQPGTNHRLSLHTDHLPADLSTEIALFSRCELGALGSQRRAHSD